VEERAFEVRRASAQWQVADSCTRHSVDTLVDKQAAVVPVVAVIAADVAVVAGAIRAFVAADEVEQVLK